MAESNTFVGVTSGVNLRTTHQLLTSKDKYSKAVQWAAWNKNSAMRAFGVEAYGVESMQDLNKFGTAKATGRIVRRDGGIAVSGFINATTGSSFHVGRLGNFNPELVEGGDQYIYSWFRLVATRFIPDVDIQDNQGEGKLIDLKAMRAEEMKSQYVADFNYCILGNSSAPDTGVIGPSVQYCDIPNLISVSQTTLNVGGIDRATTGNWWKNGIKACTSIGGGGEMDRPLVLRRSLLKLMNDLGKYAESVDDYMLLATQGAWQYYDRLMYADTIQGGRGSVVTKQKYDAAGIQNYAFGGAGMVWDPAVTVPSGATASTEAIYVICVPNFFISFHKEEAFKYSGWEEPREHDQQKTIVASIKTRYTPGVTSRRTHGVLYNMPACGD